MAFLRFRSVYCIPETDINLNQRYVFSSICITTAALSVYGACVQLRSWYNLIKEREARRKPSSNPTMAFCLALADLFTCIGVIAMAVLFIAFNPPYVALNMFVPQKDCKLNVTHPNQTWYKYVGVPIESFTMFSYISSYLWTFGYALDICLQIYNKDKCIPMRTYQLCFWTIPFWLVFWGQYGYLTGSNHYCSIRDQEIIHYMVCFVPLVCVFVVLPFVYLMAYRKVLKNVKTSNACFTNSERELLFAVKKKFLQIWLVFMVCWVVNVVDGFFDLQMLFSNTKNIYIDDNDVDFPHTLHHFGIWMAEAVVNPLQGFLNCIVYRQSRMYQCCVQCCSPKSVTFKETQTPSEPSETFLINSHENLERSPLLQARDSSRGKSGSYTRSQPRFVAKLLGEPKIT